MANTLFVTMSLEEFTTFIQDVIRKTFVEISLPTPPSSDKEELITIDEASSLLKVSPVTLHKWKKRKLIPFYRIERRIYFKKQELLSSLKSFTSKKKSV